MTLTKDHIAAFLQSRFGVSKPDCYRYLEAVLSLIKHSLTGDGDVLITGFGKFTVRRQQGQAGTLRLGMI